MITVFRVEVYQKGVVPFRVWFVSKDLCDKFIEAVTLSRYYVRHEIHEYENEK